MEMKKFEFSKAEMAVLDHATLQYYNHFMEIKSLILTGEHPCYFDGKEIGEKEMKELKRLIEVTYNLRIKLNDGRT